MEQQEWPSEEKTTGESRQRPASMEGRRRCESVGDDSSSSSSSSSSTMDDCGECSWSRHETAHATCWRGRRVATPHGQCTQSGFGPGNSLPGGSAKRKGGVAAWRWWSRHFNVSTLVLFLLACLAVCGHSLPVPESSRPLRTSETDWRRHIYDEPTIDEDMPVYLDTVATVMAGDMIEPVESIAALALSDIEAKALAEHQDSATNPKTSTSSSPTTAEARDESDGDRHANNRRELSWSWNHDTIRRYKRSSAGDFNGLWENATIPFAFDSKLRKGVSSVDYDVMREAIRKAMRTWEDNTCIRFVPYIRNFHQNFIMFAPPNPDLPNRKCSSYIGRMRGIQPIRLGPDCQYSPGVIMHELGHAIGFYHEQQRPDRDRFVRVFEDNIQDGEGNQRAFMIRRDVRTYNESYDIDSIMHYGNYFLSKDPRSLQTIQVRNNPNYLLGQRDHLSPIDIAQTNKMYGCPYPERCLTRKHPLTAGRVISIMIKVSSERRIKWLSCRKRDGMCRRMTCGPLSEVDCTDSPTHCGNELFMLERDPRRLVSHKIYAGDPVMLRSHAYPLSDRVGRRQRRSNNTHQGFLTCLQKDGLNPPQCLIRQCNGNNPYADCPNAKFFFLPAHTPHTAREEANMSIDDPSESVITENTPVGLCQEDEGGTNVRCINCQPKAHHQRYHYPCIPMDCGPRRDAAKHCRKYFVRLRQWSALTEPATATNNYSK